MTPHKTKIVIACLALLAFCLFVFCPDSVSAQTGETTEELKQKVEVLTKETRYTEALPLLEKIVAAEPDNARAHFYLGFALIAQATNTKDAAERKALSLRARAAFVRAKDLEIEEPLVDALIASIPVDGTVGPSFSENIRANALMTQAEGFYSRGKLDDALKTYQKALDLDPKLYHAALFSGDVFMQRGDYVQSMVWYERAIAIDPNKETAYRYSATPLMKQGN
jgi:tetratricopeptide (TPR) repeat protein